MTITADNAVVARITRMEAKILAHYAAGESAKEILTATGADMGTVSMTLDALAGNNRQLAHNLAVAWQARAKAVAAARGVSAPPAPRPAPAPPQAPAPAPGPAVAPEPQENIDGIADLLDTAETSGNPKIERAAVKIRDLVKLLQEDLAEHSREARLRDEQAQLEQRLAEIRKELRPQRQSVQAAPAGSDVSPRSIRAWATANDVACPQFGKIPATVLDAYHTAVAA